MSIRSKTTAHSNEVEAKVQIYRALFISTKVTEDHLEMLTSLRITAKVTGQATRLIYFSTPVLVMIV